MMPSAAQPKAVLLGKLLSPFRFNRHSQLWATAVEENTRDTGLKFGILRQLRVGTHCEMIHGSSKVGENDTNTTQQIHHSKWNFSFLSFSFFV